MSFENVTVYSSDRSLKNIGKLIPCIFREVIGSRELAWILFVKSLKESVRQSFLSYFWIIASPFFASMAWFYLNATGVVQIADTGVPYPMFVLIGQTFWTLFTDGFKCPISEFKGGIGVMTKLRVAPEAFIMNGIARIILNFILKIVLYIVVFSFLGYPPNLSLFLLPLIALSFVMAGLSLGVWLIPVQSFFFDLGKVVKLLIPILMFTAPVVYPVPVSGLARSITTMNPLTYLLEAARSIIFGSPVENLSIVFMVLIVSFFVMIGGFMFMRICLPHIIERQGM